jgi:hypothetical protein
MFVCCVYMLLSCVGRGLCDGLITRPEESYRVSVCVWSRNPEKGGQRSILLYKCLWMNELRSAPSNVPGGNGLLLNAVRFVCLDEWLSHRGDSLHGCTWTPRTGIP